MSDYFTATAGTGQQKLDAAVDHLIQKFGLISVIISTVTNVFKVSKAYTQIFHIRTIVKWGNGLASLSGRPKGL
jgi:hypothetical protein